MRVYVCNLLASSVKLLNFYQPKRWVIIVNRSLHYISLILRRVYKWMLTVSYWTDHRAPNVGARESNQGAKGNCNPIGGTTLWTNQYPRVLVSSCICIKRWPSRPSLQREAHWTCKLYMYRGNPGPKRGSGWVGDCGGGYGGFLG
jgi:hypothetical protein